MTERRVAARMLVMDGAGNICFVLDKNILFDVDEVVENIIEATKRDVDVVVIDVGKLRTKHLESDGTANGGLVPTEE